MRRGATIDYDGRSRPRQDPQTNVPTEMLREGEAPAEPYGCTVAPARQEPRPPGIHDASGRLSRPRPNGYNPMMLCRLCQCEAAYNFHHFIPRTLHSNK